MSVLGWIILGVTVWLVLCIPAAVILGRMISVSQKGPTKPLSVVRRHES